jgi:hypothetical protein
MRIALLTYQHNLIKTENAINKISLLSSIYTYFFYKYLSKIIPEENIDILDLNHNFTNETVNYDYAFILVNRGASHIKRWDEFRSKINKLVFTISPTSSIKGRENLLIHYAGKRHSWSVKVNWMADPEILRPMKEGNKIVILVDHKYYGDKKSRLYQRDKSEMIIRKLLEYKEKNDNKYNGKEIVIKHIIANNIIEVNKIEDIDNTYFKQGLAVPYGEVVEVYNKCDIFVNTHDECMGLTNLECGMAGAMILTFPGYLKDEFRNQLHHYVIRDENNINWEEIFNSINPGLSRLKVESCTYERNINYIYNTYLK